MIYQGLELMGIGMGTVFTFLALLVLATNFMSKILTRFWPEPAPVHPINSVPGNISPNTVAAITAAVHQYRHAHGLTVRLAPAGGSAEAAGTPAPGQVISSSGTQLAARS